MLTLAHIAIPTGRTHQIRVHLSAIGHPIVGDALYGGVHRRVPGDLRAVTHLDRPFLHAARLAFTHPDDGRRMEFESPLPDDLQRVLDELTERQEDHGDRLVSTRVFAVDVENVPLPERPSHEVATVRHPPCVVLIPIQDDGRVVLIRQYRHSVKRDLWELPAGSLNPGESPEAAAATRECEEEDEAGAGPGRAAGGAASRARLLRRRDGVFQS